jgi:hypothetical protein
MTNRNQNGQGTREDNAGLGLHPTGVRAQEDVEQTGSALYPSDPDIPPANDDNYTPQHPQVSTPPNDIPSNALPPTQDDTYGQDGQTEDVTFYSGTRDLEGAPELDESGAHLADDASKSDDTKPAKTSKGR